MPATAATTGMPWHDPPSVVGNAGTLQLTPEQCGLPFWLDEVAGGQLRGLVGGHAPDTVTPEHIRRHGPLREALIAEFAFNAVAEERAVRAITTLVTLAPDLPCLEYYVTQLLDEARHGYTYRHHLLEVGVPAADLDRTIRYYTEIADQAILGPLQEFGLRAVDEHGFIGGALVLTVLVEGVIGPITELAERKWHRLDLAAAQVHLGASADELRHLAVGSEIVRRHLAASPELQPALAGLVKQGRDFWDELPMRTLQMWHEALFQEGMREHAALVGDHEIWDGRRLLDTTPAERVDTARRWVDETQRIRLRYMGFDAP